MGRRKPMSNARKLLAVGATALALGLIAAVAWAATRPGDTHTHDAGAFAFDYPRDWKDIEGVAFPLAAAAGREDIGRDTVGLSADSWVTAYVLKSDVPIDAGNVADLLPATLEQFTELAGANDGTVLREPFVVTVAGLPGVRVVVALRSVRGTLVEEQVTRLFDGVTSYVITCQSTPADAAEIASGCDTVLQSFTRGT